MIHEAIIIAALSIVIALIRKKDISTLEKVKIKGLGFFIVSFLIQTVGVYIASNYNESSIGSLIEKYFIWIHCISYQLILIGLALNFKKTYMKFFFVGTILNFTVILFNGMQMPVKLPDDISNVWENFLYLKNGSDLIHTVMTQNTNLKFLADIIHLKKPYPFNKVLSIGDVILLFGFFILIQEETKFKIKSKEKKLA